jgi:hypothetical protein
MNPFTFSRPVKDDDVMIDLVELGKSIPMPPESLNNGSINLTDRETFSDRTLPNGQRQSPYDRWLELIGQSGLREKLTQIVKSEAFQKAPQEVRLDMVSGLVSYYQEATKPILFSEYKSLVRAYGQDAAVQAAKYKGNPKAVVDSISRVEKLLIRPKLTNSSSYFPNKK